MALNTKNSQLKNLKQNVMRTYMLHIMCMINMIWNFKVFILNYCNWSLGIIFVINEWLTNSVLLDVRLSYSKLYIKILAWSIRTLASKLKKNCEKKTTSKEGILNVTNKTDSVEFHRLRNWFWSSFDIEIASEPIIFEFHFLEKFQLIAYEASNR